MKEYLEETNVFAEICNDIIDVTNRRTRLSSVEMNAETYNEIGLAFFKSDYSQQKFYLDVATELSTKYGYELKRPRLSFTSQYAKWAIARMPFAFVEAARIVYGLTFNHSAAENVHTFFSSYKGVKFAITVTEL